MTAAFPQARLRSAFVVSLAMHAALAAALASAVRGGQPASDVRPAALLASLREAPPVQAPRKPAPASARAARGPSDAATPGAPLPVPYYYRASELTERPAPLARVEPRFPPGAPDSGRLKMRLYINESGMVDAIDITEAEPAGVFEQAATQAFAAARFRPGHKDGSAVKSQIALEISFGAPLPLPTPRRPL
jgi:TonB family protein